MALIARMDTSPRGWYENVMFELPMLYGYLESVEHQIEESIERFRNEKQTKVIEYDGGWADVITVHHGIHDNDYHLETVFEKFFPNLQRRSALITLYSFFEYQLFSLCMMFKKEIEGEASLKSKQYTWGIGRSTDYLKDDACLLLDKEAETWKEIDNIRLIRNAIVHNDAKLNENEKTDDLINHARNHGLLVDEEWLKVPAEYLPHAVNTFGRFLEEIGRLIYLSQKIS